MRYCFGYILLISLALVVSCKQPARDIEPPILISRMAQDTHHIQLIFNEPVTLSQLSLTPYTGSIQLADTLLTLDTDLLPGQEYHLCFTATDASGNSLIGATYFYGYNAQPAQLMIQQFTVKHSKTHKERIQFLALSDGNLGGITLTLSHDNLDDSFIFPNYPIKKGQKITLLCRDPGTSKDAFDFIHPFTYGLPDKAGTLILLSSPDNQPEVMDAVVYQNNQNLSNSSQFVASYQWLLDHNYWAGNPIDIAQHTPTRIITKSQKQPSTTAQYWTIHQKKS